VLHLINAEAKIQIPSMRNPKYKEVAIGLLSIVGKTWTVNPPFSAVIPMLLFQRNVIRSIRAITIIKYIIFLTNEKIETPTISFVNHSYRAVTVAIARQKPVKKPGNFHYPINHAEPSENTGTLFVPPPVRAALNVADVASVTNPRAPAPAVAAAGRVATVFAIVFT
jgi:hypothetical protein